MDSIMKNFENELTTETMTQACHNGFTRLVKPFRSDLDSSVEPKAQSDSQSSQTKYRNCVAHSYGFTLAETLITVAILGVVAAITIPAIINHQTESANRTKLKKAMTTYEKALNQMIIENDLKTNQAINDFGSEGGNCKNTTEYFKKVEGSGCRFKTADRIWWDITDIENPLVMLKDKYKDEEIAALKELAKKEDDREVFGMVGRLDDSTGVLRINDKGAETETPNKEYMTKLYNFMNKVENAVPVFFSDSDFGKNCVYNSDKTKCTYTYNCPTAEDATKTCTADMTKVTFENTCVPILDCGIYPTGIESCPMDSGDTSPTSEAAVVELPERMSWYDATEACEKVGLKLANYSQINQLYKSGSILENDTFWIAESMSDNSTYYFNVDYDGGLYLENKSNYDNVVCVGK